jgi:hypothetical protein
MALTHSLCSTMRVLTSGYEPSSGQIMLGCPIADSIRCGGTGCHRATAVPVVVRLREVGQMPNRALPEICLCVQLFFLFYFPSCFIFSILFVSLPYPTHPACPKTSQESSARVMETPVHSARSMGTSPISESVTTSEMTHSGSLPVRQNRLRCAPAPRV